MTKIEALKKTIYNLENNVYKYNWLCCDSCNCGILAKTICGGNIIGRGDVPRNEKDFNTPWAGYSVCLVTGIELPQVWKALKDCGFTHKEICELENLSNEKILNKIGVQFSKYKGQIFCDSRGDKSVLIKYLKAWVEILEEEKLNSEQEVKECDATKSNSSNEAGTKIIHVYHKVEVPETISKSVPETILS